MISNRRAALRSVLPAPTGSVTAGDRRFVIGIYPLGADEPPLPPVSGGGRATGAQQMNQASHVQYLTPRPRAWHR